MRVVNGKIYRVTSQLSGNVVFVECAREEEVMEYVATRHFGDSVSVVRVLPNGKTPKVAIYSNPHYKLVLKLQGHN